LDSLDLFYTKLISIAIMVHMGIVQHCIFQRCGCNINHENMPVYSLILKKALHFIGVFFLS